MFNILALHDLFIELEHVFFDCLKCLQHYRTVNDS